MPDNWWEQDTTAPAPEDKWWENDTQDAPTAPPPETPAMKPSGTKGTLPEADRTFGGVMSEVPGVIADYGLGALKGLGRLGTGLVAMDPFNPMAAISYATDVNRARAKAELDKKLGLKATGGVQEVGGMIPYLAVNPQGAAANAALAAGGSFLETQDPTQALGAGLMGGAAGSLAPVARRWGGKLMKGAVNQYEKALHPGTRAAKVETARIVPELLRRGVTGDLESLAARGTAQSEAVGQKIGARYAGATKTVDAAQLADELEALKAPFMAQSGIGGVTPIQGKNFSGLGSIPPNTPIVIDEAAVGRINDIQSKLREFGTLVPPKELWKYRQVLDRVVKASNGFTKELSRESAAEISLGARRAIQSEINKAVPNLEKLNAEYSLWESLQDIASETARRKIGQQNAPGMLSRGAGAIVGATIGGLAGGSPYAAGLGGMAGSQATKKLTELMSSPAWRTMSAVNKAKLSQLLTSGNSEEALNYATRLLTARAASSGFGGRGE